MTDQIHRREQSVPAAEGLADHLDEVVQGQDVAIDMIADGGPRTMTRDEAVRESILLSEWSRASGPGGAERPQRDGQLSCRQGFSF